MLRSFLLIILNIEVMEMDTLLIIWVVLFAVFVVFEAVTVQLVSIWFAIFNRMTNKEELIGKLAEMYNEPIMALVEEPEESEGNVDWVASW